ncbi:hypothetical protein BJV74DRAFT_143291 [Russula compacta]|nr:hypothetical protein BJV74DRAFT_143291 [Russula compacta]
MSGPLRQQPDAANINERDGFPDQPPSTQNQPSQGGSNFGDSSGPLFSMYSKFAEEEDNKMTDRWTKDADGILIFTGLFSASVAALLAVSIQDLIPNSQDISAFYLEKIFEQLFLNVTPSSIPSTIPRPPPFSPPRYAIWVNSLWFLSLVISLTAALLATSLQQWARRYVRLTQPPRCSPEKRARMRAFFADGVDKLHIPWAVEGLPALLHLSLFLFFSGLLVLLLNVNHTVFLWVLWCVGVSLMMYGWITVIPIFRHDSPYYAPLSGSAWLLYTGILYAFFKVLVYFGSAGCFTRTWLHFCDSKGHYYYKGIVGGLEKAAEETASKQSSLIDLRILNWTLGTLGDDDLLEKFFDAIPGFINSSLVMGLKRDYPHDIRRTFSWPLAAFLRRTLSSSSILDSVKSHRLIICIDAADALDASNAFSSLSISVEQGKLSLPQSVETGHALARRCTGKKSIIALPMRFIVAGILMTVSEHDDRWIALAKDQFGIPEHVLRDNIAHGDNSVLLSIVIHLARQAIHSRYDPWPWMILSTVSQFDIRHTVPGLQHEFCALWNELVIEAKNQGYYSIPIRFLRAIRHAYIALHQGTEAAPTAFSAFTEYNDLILLRSSSYPRCTLAGHHPDSTPDGPHHIQGETQPLPAVTAVADLSIISSDANPLHAAPQQAKETTVTHSPTDLVIGPSDNTSPHSRPFLSASASAESVHFLSQVTSLTYPSILTRDMNYPVPTEVSHPLPWSTLTAAETDIHITEARDTSHAAAATSLTFPRPEPTLATITPSTAPGLPSAVVSSLAGVSNAFQRTTLAATLSHPQQNNKEHHTATPSATTYISEISSTAHFIPGGGATLEGDKEVTEVPPLVSHSQSPPALMPAPHNNVIPEVSSFMESPLFQADSTSHALASSATTHSRNALQVTSILDAHITGNIRAVSRHDDTRGIDTPIPMEVFPDANRSMARAPGIGPVTLPPDDRKDGRN